MKKTIIILVAVFATLALAANMFAFGPKWGRGHGGGAGPGGDCNQDYIKSIPGMNLTAEQTAKIDALRITHMKDMKPIHDKMFIKRGDLKLLWLEKKPDEKKIAETRKEIRMLRDQMEDQWDSYRLKTLNVLTPDQKDKLDAYRPACGFAPGMKHGNGWHDGPGPHGGDPGMGMHMRDNR